MKRLKNKFLVLQLDCDLDAIAQLLNNNQYTENKGIGITSKKLDGNNISATFVERKIISEQISYPNGETKIMERVKYIYLDFKIRLLRDNFFLFQLYNAPLSVKRFLFFLSCIFPSLVVEKFIFDLFNFRKILKNHSTFNNVRVTSLKASSLPFSDKSVAKVEVFSEHDSFHELNKVYGETGYRLDRLVFTISHKGEESELSASSLGSITFTDGLSEEVIVNSFSRSITY